MVDNDGDVVMRGGGPATRTRSKKGAAAEKSTAAPAKVTKKAPAKKAAAGAAKKAAADKAAERDARRAALLKEYHDAGHTEYTLEDMDDEEPSPYPEEVENDRDPNAKPAERDEEEEDNGEGPSSRAGSSSRAISKKLAATVPEDDEELLEGEHYICGAPTKSGGSCKRHFIATDKYPTGCSSKGHTHWKGGEERYYKVW